jgi:hypothetical protein
MRGAWIGQYLLRLLAITLTLAAKLDINRRTPDFPGGARICGQGAHAGRELDIDRRTPDFPGGARICGQGAHAGRELDINRRRPFGLSIQPGSQNRLRSP